MNTAGKGGRLSHQEGTETGRCQCLSMGGWRPRTLIASLGGLCFSLSSGMYSNVLREEER